MSLAACKENAPKVSVFVVPNPGLEIPKLDGWVADASVQLQDDAKGGKAFKLTRKGKTLGAPRLTVRLAPQTEKPTKLEPFLRQHLKRMSTMEAAKRIRIVSVDQKPISIGPRRAHKVKHEFIDLNSNTSLTQVQVIFVLDGRGITVDVGGRTELFHPLASDITRMLEGIKTPAMRQAPAKPKDIKTIEAKPVAEDTILVEPVDIDALRDGT